MSIVTHSCNDNAEYESDRQLQGRSPLDPPKVPAKRTPTVCLP